MSDKEFRRLRRKQKIASFFRKTPSDNLNELWKNTFGVNKNVNIAVFVTTICTMLLCYFYEMIYGLGCPDTLCEGVHYYRNANFSTSQARWNLRFLNIFGGNNVIIPFFTVLGYCLMIGIAVMLICRMIRITKKLPAVCLTAMMISFPIVWHHFAYLYMALAYSFSFLASVLGIRFIRKRKFSGFLLGTLCFLFMLGSYQAYIGAVSAFALIMLIFDSLHEAKYAKNLSTFGLTVLSGLAASILNIPFSRLMMLLFHTGTESRVAAFSVKSIFQNLGFSLQYSYKWFFSYFNNTVLGRKYLYTALLLICIILLIISLAKRFRENSVIGCLTMLVSVLLLPLAMNFLLLLMPENGIRDIMRYQYVLIFVLLFILLEYCSGKVFAHILYYVSLAVILVLFWGNVISANATAKMYKLSYDENISQAQLMLERIYETDGYVADETPIILGGLISIENVQNQYPQIFRYAEKEGGPVFWADLHGEIYCRYYLFNDYLGVDPKWVSNEEFIGVVTSDEYRKMPSWPEEGSVKIIHGKAVVKIWEEPPLW